MKLHLIAFDQSCSVRDHTVLHATYKRFKPARAEPLLVNPIQKRTTADAR